MNTFHRVLGLAVVILMAAGLAPLLVSESHAENPRDSIDIHPGQPWVWEIEYDERNDPTITVSASASSMPADDATYAASSGYASIDGRRVLVNIPSDYPGDVYNVKVRMEDTQPVQVAFYEIVFNVTAPVYPTLTFVSNGGSAVSPVEVRDPSSYGNQPVPDRDGFTFAGWYADPSLETPFNWGTAVSESMVLYAGWTEDAHGQHTYTIHYTGGTGGSGHMDDSVETGDGEHAQVALEPCAYTRDGYYFTGWRPTTGGAGIYLPSEYLDVPADSTVTVSAQWAKVGSEPYTHAVHYYTQKGTGTMADTVVPDGNRGESDVTLADCAFVYPGYRFTAWKLGQLGEFPAGAEVPVGANSLLTAVAQWERVESTTYHHIIHYVANGGKGAMSDSVVVDGNSGTTEIVLSECAFTAPEGKVFDGWNVLGTTYQPGQKILAGPMVTNATAVWKTGTSTVTVYIDDVPAEFDIGKKVGDVPIPVNAGHSFSGWFSDSARTQGVAATTALAEGMHLYAKWTEDSPSTTYTHTVRYSANGGTGTMADTALTDAVSGDSQVTLAVCGFVAPEGKHFSGWKIGNEVYQTGNRVLVAGNATVTATAQWAEITYTHTVAYEANGGTGDTPDTVVRDTEHGDSQVTLDQCLSDRAGYAFAGWKIGSSVLYPGERVNVAGNSSVTAVAQWVETAPGSYTHTVAYDRNGGEGSMLSTVFVDSVGGGSDVVLAGCGFVKSGSHFTGWKVGEKVYQPGDRIEVSGNASVTAVAQWAEDSGDGDKGFSIWPYLLIIVGTVLALVGIRYHPVLIVIGCAVAAIGFLEILGVIDLF